MLNPSKTPKQSEVTVLSSVKYRSPHAPTGSSTTELSTPHTPAATVDVEPSHRVVDCESATMQQLGRADVVQQLLTALQANLKLLERNAPAPATTSSPAKKASLVRASKPEYKIISES